MFRPEQRLVSDFKNFANYEMIPQILTKVKRYQGSFMEQIFKL